MSAINTEDIEIDLLLEAVYRQFGYDYRQYSRASLTRRVKILAHEFGVKNISNLIPLLLHEKGVIETLVQGFSITVTEMFRDPFVYRKIREKIVPYLKTYPSVNIWVAGCATGEEVYSLAILLKEEGIYERSKIYATDINEKSLQIARDGIYPASETKANTKNYQKAGGKASFADFTHTKYQKTIISNELKENITFISHNLVTDSVFNEMQFIICRNVLIYFDSNLQNQVLKLFYQSLLANGFLCLGTKEKIRFSELSAHFAIIGEEEKIYKKINGTSIE